MQRVSVSPRACHHDLKHVPRVLPGLPWHRIWKFPPSPPRVSAAAPQGGAIPWGPLACAIPCGPLPVALLSRGADSRGP
eukprot:5618574-Pyramimonas_sp.AAC.1